MGKNRSTTIDVKCINGHVVFERYNKEGEGRLLKVYRDEIGTDHSKHSDKPELGEIIYCGICEPPLAVAAVQMIHGRVAYKVKPTGIPKTIA